MTLYGIKELKKISALFIYSYKYLVYNCAALKHRDTLKVSTAAQVHLHQEQIKPFVLNVLRTNKKKKKKSKPKKPCRNKSTPNSAMICVDSSTQLFPNMTENTLNQQ